MITGILICSLGYLGMKVVWVSDIQNPRNIRSYSTGETTSVSILCVQISTIFYLYLYLWERSTLEKG